ncbi:MAG: transcription termination/antitermination protein NusG [Candidatus Saccharicenans sp.]
MNNWYVINTKPRKEFQVESLFSQAGFKVYNPKYAEDSRIKPFFPGYLFLRFNYPSEYRKVIYTRGVKKVLGNKKGPIPIELEAINFLRAREKHGLIEIMKYGEEPGPGDEIMIMEGPLKGFKGLFYKELSGRERVMILLNYVAYQGSLMIEKNKIKKIQTTAGRSHSQPEP